jgi:DNA-binding MarR family transcriptional regulator
VLAALAGGSLPRLSQVVGRLEKRGWVQRSPDPANGRYTLAILTEEGWAKVAATARRSRITPPDLNAVDA